MISDTPKISFATCPYKGTTCAVAMENDLQVYEYINGTSIVTEKPFIIRSSQKIKCVSFVCLQKQPVLHADNGTNADAYYSDSIIVGGDKKLLELFNYRNSGHNYISNNKQEGGSYLPPVASFGPHQKRIEDIVVVHDNNNANLTHSTNLNSTDVINNQTEVKIATIVFSDSCGEVFMVDLMKKESNVFQFQPVATFLLQHTATVLTTFNIMRYPSYNMRLVTCDRDSHVRVSKFPNTFIIEQFLWAATLKPTGGHFKQSSVIATEEPTTTNTISESASVTEAVMGRNVSQAPVTCVLEFRTGDVCESTIIVTGDVVGRVAIWSCSNGAAGTVDLEDNQGLPKSVQAGEDDEFHLIQTFDFSSAAVEHGGEIIGLSQLSSRNGNTGILVAINHADNMYFIPILVSARGVKVDCVDGTDDCILPSPDDNTLAIDTPYTKSLKRAICCESPLYNIQKVLLPMSAPVICLSACSSGVTEREKDNLPSLLSLMLQRNGTICSIYIAAPSIESSGGDAGTKFSSSIQLMVKELIPPQSSLTSTKSLVMTPNGKSIKNNNVEDLDTKDIGNGIPVDWVATLASLDAFAGWQTQYNENKRKRGGSDDDDDDSDVNEDKNKESVSSSSGNNGTRRRGHGKAKC
eukprot:Tbor_TRINITY_DN4088_c0_g1::TRINITY_DN4088_c0_g1_i1::g.11766::m.11766